MVIGLIFIAICIIIIIFIATIFMSHVNSILYNVKLEMYSINKAAIIAVNKNTTSVDDFRINRKAYRDYFEESLKNSFNLDDKFQNKDALINSISIIDYDVYEKGKKDSFTRNRCER